MPKFYRDVQVTQQQVTGFECSRCKTKNEDASGASASNAGLGAVCGGNDGDTPCAYTTERPAGCLRAERLKKLKAWLATPEAQTELAEALIAADAACKYLDAARKVTPEMLTAPFDI